MIIAISTRVKCNLLLGRVPGGKIAVVGEAVHAEVFRPDISGDNTLRAEYPHAQGLFIGIAWIAGRIVPFKRQLCATLNETQTVFPGTNLRLIFKIGSSEIPPDQEV